MPIAEHLKKYGWYEPHQLYLRGVDGDKRADLREADLREADLRGANLRGADLSWADLSWADLREADLREANLRGANLSWADLSWADLRWADLSWANLSWANLSEANLRWADLRGADLRWAKNFHFLTQTDHGYLIYATKIGNQWRIRAGCRDYTIAQARKHWGAKSYPLRSSGSRIVALLNWLEQEPTSEESA